MHTQPDKMAATPRSLFNDPLEDTEIVRARGVDAERRGSLFNDPLEDTEMGAAVYVSSYWTRFFVQRSVRGY